TAADPRCRLPRPQNLRGVQLRPPTRNPPRRHHPAGRRPLPHRSPQRGPPWPTRHRENPRCDRPRRRRLPYRTAGLVPPRPRTVSPLAPPATENPPVAPPPAPPPCHTGQRVLFATATDWVARLQDAHQRDRLPAELTKLRRY